VSARTTGETRYANRFAALAERGEGAFVPFAVLGDPDRETGRELVRTLARSGADALELGIPFSDPVADGPAIQAADLRARDSGVRVEDCFAIVAAVRDEFPELPIGLLVYANLVVHAGAETFYARASRAGVDSVLVADAPLLESARLEPVAIAHGIAPVLIASPNISDERLADVASRSRGYVYVTSRPGVTGVETDALRDDSASVLLRLASIESAPPALLGFGIATPDHVHRALSFGAAGAISGSAIARRIERHVDGRGGAELDASARMAMLEDVADFVRAMKRATVGA
jgi:tryptophan synthase alpha chain